MASNPPDPHQLQGRRVYFWLSPRLAMSCLGLRALWWGALASLLVREPFINAHGLLSCLNLVFSFHFLALWWMGLTALGKATQAVFTPSVD
eukprot:317939-Pelagomonas_calceolata.AAC.1